NHRCSASAAVALMLAGLLAWPSASLAQLGGLLPAPTTTTTPSTVTGKATAAQSVLLGLLGTATSTSLASTGISSTNAESDVGQDTGSIPSLLGAEVINAATYSYPDEVDSAASLAKLGLTVAGISIYAVSVVAVTLHVFIAVGEDSYVVIRLIIYDHM